jgi:excisionase family DNA binding protein
MIQFLTNLSGQEFKEFLKDALREILAENQTKPNPPEILTIQEASEFLKLKINTLYEKTSRKQIPHFKKGNKLYFHRSELEAWVKAGKVKTQEEIETEAATYTLTKKVA